MTESADGRDIARKPLSIAMVCPYDLSVVGGVQSHVFDVVAEMLARGWSVSVLAPVTEPTAVAQRLGAWPQWLVNAGPARAVAVNGSRAPVRVALGQRRQVRQWLERERPDVVHVHEPFVPALARPAVHAASRLRRRGPARLAVIGTFHAAVDADVVLRLARPWLAATARTLDTAIAVSPMAAQTLAAVGSRTQPRIIVNPVATARFSRAVIPKPAPPATAGRALFLGRGDEPRKGLADLLAAWPLVRAARPDAELIVAGRLADTRGVDGISGVRVLGEVSEADKPGVFAGVDAYVAPHRGGESMGLVLVEAMASGTAVVATDLPAFRAVAADGAAADLVAVNDPAALAEGVLRVLGDHRYREALVAAGRQRAGDFDVCAVVDEIEVLYRTV